jgi:hypothetical protein
MKKAASASSDARVLEAILLGSDEPADRALYQEYVRGFDEIPTLDDAVIIPPRPPAPPNFVRGERRNLRNHDRPDGYEQREANLAELERLYREYLDPKPAGPKRKATSAKKTSRRKTRRPKRAAG